MRVDTRPVCNCESMRTVNSEALIKPHNYSVQYTRLLIFKVGPLQTQSREREMLLTHRRSHLTPEAVVVTIAMDHSRLIGPGAARRPDQAEQLAGGLSKRPIYRKHQTSANAANGLSGSTRSIRLSRLPFPADELERSRMTAPHSCFPMRWDEQPLHPENRPECLSGSTAFNGSCYSFDPNAGRRLT